MKEIIEHKDYTQIIDHEYSMQTIIYKVPMEKVLAKEERNRKRKIRMCEKQILNQKQEIIETKEEKINQCLAVIKGCERQILDWEQREQHVLSTDNNVHALNFIRECKNDCEKTLQEAKNELEFLKKEE